MCRMSCFKLISRWQFGICDSCALPGPHLLHPLTCQQGALAGYRVHEEVIASRKFHFCIYYNKHLHLPALHLIMISSAAFFCCNL